MCLRAFNVSFLVMILVCLCSCSKPTTQIVKSIKTVPLLTCELAKQLMVSEASTRFQALLASHPSNDVYAVHCISKTKYPGMLVKLGSKQIEQYVSLGQTKPKTHSVSIMVHGKIKPFSAPYQTNPEVDPMGVLEDYKVVRLSTMPTPDWQPFRAAEHK